MAEQQKINKAPHVLLFPFPLQSHINPLLQFGKRLISKGVRTTLINTTYINSILSCNKTTMPTEMEAISDGFDEGGLSAADSDDSYLKTFREVGSKTLADLIKKLQSEGTTIDAIIYDSFITWALDVAMDFGIKGASFLTEVCGVNSIYYHVHKGLIPVPAGPTISVPGLPQLERWEAPSFLHSYVSDTEPDLKDMLLNQFSNLNEASWVFTNTFYQLEKEVIEWMRKMWNLKVIGPTIPSMYLDKRLEDDEDYSFNIIKPNHIECMNWLNEKPKKSVVYVSYGSLVEVESEQMEEIAWGLSDSNVNFLWVVRADEQKKLPKEFMDKKITDNCLIVPWCRQLDVLAHESTGCFVTHCGFSSTLEAISLGVPMVGMPRWFDQTISAKLLEIWGVGIRVKIDEKGIVRRENLVSCIKKIMDDERGVVVRKNVAKWRDLAKFAVNEGGSSDKDIDDFVCELKHEC